MKNSYDIFEKRIKKLLFEDLTSARSCIPTQIAHERLFDLFQNIADSFLPLAIANNLTRCEIIPKELDYPYIIIRVKKETKEFYFSLYTHDTLECHRSHPFESLPSAFHRMQKNSPQLYMTFVRYLCGKFNMKFK